MSRRPLPHGHVSSPTQPAPQPTDARGLPTSDLRARLPIDPQSGAPLPPRAQPGYYPGFSTLAQQKFWDEATRSLVLKRVNDPPPLRFFSPREAQLMQAVIDRIVPQDDRAADHKIPILNTIDDRLFHNRIDGYRYEDMPPDTEAHRLGLQAIDIIAREAHGKSFVDLPPDQQELVLQSIHDCQPPAAHDIWAKMNCQRYWMLLVQDCIEGYYAHPWAWDEIGFGGPAYPRGYMRLEHGLPEPWEVEEQRYEWSGPQWSVTNEYKPIGDGQQATTPGQEGTH